MYRIFPVVLIGLITLAPVVAAEPLSDRIAALTKDFKGTVVLYAKNLAPDRNSASRPIRGCGRPAPSSCRYLRRSNRWSRPAR